MPQLLRVLSESDRLPPVAELRRVLPGGFEIVVEDGNEQNWRRLHLRHDNGQQIAVIERNPLEEGGAVQDFANDLDSGYPSRAAEWLKHYLSHAKVVYTLEPKQGVQLEDGWLALQMAQAYLWKKFGGILQADGEGFTNREGQHVLWQFESTQTGELEAAIMDDSGRWMPFTMDMGDPEQVEAFRRGEVPQRAKRIA